MARLVGVDLPRDKRLEVALTYIYGIGRTRALETLKDKNVFVVGLDSSGEADLATVPLRAPLALVVGAEGKGLHEQARRHCDVLVRIPMSGKIPSLNVSVAAGIVLFEWKRRRKG